VSPAYQKRLNLNSDDVFTVTTLCSVLHLGPRGCTMYEAWVFLSLSYDVINFKPFFDI
jgi:hypothetical protein